MPIDVVCGMKVREDSKFESEYQGKKFYFCNSKCKADFDRNPLKYLR
jgi:YHS domain-containing protein